MFSALRHQCFEITCHVFLNAAHFPAIDGSEGVLNMIWINGTIEFEVALRTIFVNKVESKDLPARINITSILMVAAYVRQGREDTHTGRKVINCLVPLIPVRCM